MGFVSGSFRPVVGQFILHFLLLVSLDIAETRKLQASVNASIPAMFVFGDSTVDSGNNNYINTALRSNFPPYGKDFPDAIPTGRFTNGRLFTDFLASYMGMNDYIPPYLDPALSLDDLKTGACFASSATGYDPLTAQISGVIPMEKQLTYFKEYKSRMETYIGKERTTNLISKAVFIISAGTNDFMLNYYGPPIRRMTYTISAYQEFILQLSQQYIQDLLKLGAGKIVTLGILPVGCLPFVITLHSNNTSTSTRRECNEQISSATGDYNRLLHNKLASMQSQGAKIVFVDMYKSLDDMIKKPQQYGFDEVYFGCCGSGLLETAYLCNQYSRVCSDDSKYVFWDSIHPTEAAYYITFQSARTILDQFPLAH